MVHFHLFSAIIMLFNNFRKSILMFFFYVDKTTTINNIEIYSKSVRCVANDVFQKAPQIIFNFSLRWCLCGLSSDAEFDESNEVMKKAFWERVGNYFSHYTKNGVRNKWTVVDSENVCCCKKGWLDAKKILCDLEIISVNHTEISTGCLETNYNHIHLRKSIWKGLRNVGYFVSRSRIYVTFTFKFKINTNMATVSMNNFSLFYSFNRSIKQTKSHNLKTRHKCIQN